MSKSSISTCFAMLKTDQLRLFVRYYGKNVMHPDSMKSLRISQKNRESNSCENSRRLRIGVDKIKQSSCVQTTNIKTEDDRFRTLIDSVRNRATREKLGLTYICGASLIRDAIGKGVLLPEIYFHDSTHLQALPQQSLIDKGVEFVPVSKDSFRKHLSPDDLSTDGLLAVFAVPFHQRLSRNPPPPSSHPPLPLTVICDNIRDPGNMGMIIQSSVAISCDRILVTKGCVDAWDPKVLQMGCGAHFDASIETNLNWNEIGETLPTNSSIYLADSSPVDDREQNERQGNANARHHHHHHRVCEYDCIDYCNGHAVVVIGGETKGINWSAFGDSQTRDRPQQRIHVPMMAGIDSLNSAVAGSIILFEIGRQMKLHSHK